MVGRGLVAARAGAQPGDAEPLHHQLMVLLRRERRRRGLGAGPLLQERRRRQHGERKQRPDGMRDKSLHRRFLAS